MSLRLVLLLLLPVLIITASAHVPLETGDQTGRAAVLIPEPTKSWVIYERLDGECDARQYALDLKEGEKLWVSVFVTDPRTLPILIVSGPDIEDGGEIPDCLGTGMLVEQVIHGNAEYEPFTPEAIYLAGRYSKMIEKPGYYHVTVAGSGDGGNVGIAIGYEEKFAFHEWILVPLLTAGVQVWEGVPVLLVLLPLFLALACGFVFVGRRWTSLLPWNKCALFASFFYIGGAAMVLFRMFAALLKTGLVNTALITIFIILLQLVLGILLLWTGMSRRRAGLKTIAVLLLAGAFGLVIWAGLIIGPVVSMMGGIFAIYEMLRRKEEATGIP